MEVKVQTYTSLLIRVKGVILHFLNKQSVYIIGDLKEPFDFSKIHFQNPTTGTDSNGTLIQAVRKIQPLSSSYNQHEAIPTGTAIVLASSELHAKQNKKLAKVFLIQRNLSVSERIWNLIVDVSTPIDDSALQDKVSNEFLLNNHHIKIKNMIDGRWIYHLPTPIWEIVRDQVLRCL